MRTRKRSQKVTQEPQDSELPRSKTHARSGTSVLRSKIPSNLITFMIKSMARKFSMAVGSILWNLRGFAHRDSGIIGFDQFLHGRMFADLCQMISGCCRIFGPWKNTLFPPDFKEILLRYFKLEISCEFCSSLSVAGFLHDS